jgi:hypothetical protein
VTLSARHVAEQDVADALRQVARFGPFFDLTGDCQPPDEDEPRSWRALSDLGNAAGRKALDEAVNQLAAYFQSPDRRPVASLLQMSAAARLASPLLAAAADSGIVPDLQPRAVRVGFTTAGAVRLRLAEMPDGITGTPDDLAPAVRRQLLDGPLAFFTRCLRRVASLSPHVTTGNLASTLAAATRMIDTGREEPRARDLLARLLRDEPLRSAGQLETADRAADGWRFRRRNCCLFYRIPGGGTCGDCILAS